MAEFKAEMKLSKLLLRLGEAALTLLPEEALVWLEGES